MEVVSCFCSDRVVRVHAEDAEDNIVTSGAEDGAVALNMQAPTTIVGVGPCSKVRGDLDFPRLGDGRVGDVAGDDDGRDEEHRATVLTGPLTFRELELGEEGEAIAGSIKWGVRCLEVGKALEGSVS